MRIVVPIVIGLAGIVAMQAQEGRGPGRGGRPGPSIGFTALDLNGDGELDAKEIAAAPASLAKLDKNSDGQITSDELRPAMPQQGGPGGRGEGPAEGRRGGKEQEAGDGVEESVTMLMSFDANHDGKLSKVGAAGTFPRHFRSRGSKQRWLSDR